jgi:hypothetical protein
MFSFHPLLEGDAGEKNGELVYGEVLLRHVTEKSLFYVSGEQCKATFACPKHDNVSSLFFIIFAW